jgi:tetratricopeptide (TPR) repeat protein/transglutaminase-like putative cysteine protease
MVDSNWRRRTSRHVFLSLIVGAALLSSFGAFAQQPSDEGGLETQEQASAAPALELMAEFERRRDSVLALAPLIEFSLDGETWLSHEESREFLERAYGVAEHPYVRALAHNLLMLNASNSLDVERYNRLLSESGFLTNWKFIGPFPNDGMAGMDTRYGPEEDGLELGAEYEGKRQQVRWREMPETFEGGYVPISDYVEPSSSAVVYAVSEVSSRQSRRAILSVAIDGAYKLWLNGELIAEVDENLGGFVFRDEIPVRLQRGENTVAVKLGSDESSLGFHMRMLDRSREPILLDSRAPDGREGSVMSEAEPDGDASVVEVGEWLRSELGDMGNLSPNDRVTAGYINRLLASADSDHPWLRWIENLDYSALDERALGRALSLQEQRWQKEVIVEEHVPEQPGAYLLYEAAVIASEAPGATGDTALRMWLEKMRSGESGGRFRDDPRADLLEFRLYRRLGFSESALRIARSLARSYPNASNVDQYYLAALSSADRKAERREALVHAVERRPFDISLVQEAAAALREAGDTERGSQLFERVATINSHRIPFLTSWANWKRASGDVEGAIALVQQALALNPASASLHRQLAHLRLEQDRRDEAIANLETALDYFPQDAAARRLLRYLQEDEEAFYEEWRVPIDEVVALKKPADDERLDHRSLVDQKMTRVYDNGLATAYVQKAWQVYSREGADAVRSYGIGYTPDSERVEILGVTVVKEDGSTRQLYESGDYSGQSGPAAIYYDVRTRSIYVPTLEEGDVLSLEYTIEDVAYRNMFDDYFGDMWFAGSYPPREFARFGVLMPSARELQTRVANYDGAGFTVEERGDETVYLFEARELPATERESYAPGAAELLPYAHVSTYSDWDTLSDWYWNLIKDQLVVSPEIEAKVEELTSGIEDRRDKVAAIHNYVVRNTRYVGLEFGIHGFKPYRTTECFSRRFGDCKDTASLMKVMLEEAGIPANIVLVRTRNLGQVDAQPPSLALFNHAIAYVPEFDLYLDGTAGYSGSSELPPVDQGATAVVVEDGEGGRLTQIPYIPASENQSVVHTRLELMEGELSGSYQYEADGTDAPSIRRSFESAENRREALESWFTARISGATVDDVTVGNLTDIEQPASVGFDFTGGQWGVQRGQRWRLPVLGREVDWLSSYVRTSSRELPIDLGVPSTRTKRFTLSLPAEAVVASTPELRTIESRWGTFELVVETSGSSDGGEGERQEISVSASLVMTGTRVAPEEYADFREFALQIAQALDSTMSIELPESVEVGAL